MDVVRATETIDGFLVARATSKTLAELPSECRHDSVFRTLSVLLNTKPDQALVREYAWAMAADTARLRTKEPVVPGRLPVDPQTVVIQVVAARRRRKFRTQDPPAQYRGRVIVGPGAPALIEWTWSLKFVGYIATHPTGFGFDPRPRNGRVSKLPYAHFSTLVGMRFTAEMCKKDDKIELDGILGSGGQQERNRALTVLRARTEFDCPFQFTHLCEACPKGQSSCPAACRANDIVSIKCGMCGGQFDSDPAWPTATCEACNTKKERRPK